MMMVDRFNASLQKYSHNLATLHMLRAALSAIAPEALLTYLAELDGSQKGYFTAEEITFIWMRAVSHDEEGLHAFIRCTFPFSAISYSAIQNFLTHGQSQPSTIAQPHQSLHEIAVRVFQVEAETALIEKGIMDKLQSFVPMKYSRPTEEELSNYVICQQIAVDIRAVSKRLNLVENNGNLQPSHEIEYDKSLANPSLGNIQDVVKRIQARASSLGGEWLKEREGRQ